MGLSQGSLIEVDGVQVRADLSKDEREAAAALLKDVQGRITKLRDFMAKQTDKDALKFPAGFRPPDLHERRGQGLLVKLLGGADRVTFRDSKGDIHLCLRHDGEKPYSADLLFMVVLHHLAHEFVKDHRSSEFQRTESKLFSLAQKAGLIDQANIPTGPKKMYCGVLLGKAIKDH